VASRRSSAPLGPFFFGLSNMRVFALAMSWLARDAPTVAEDVCSR
jgi:hypothetical protein